MTRGPALKAEEYRQLAAEEAELAKSAITNESRAQHCTHECGTFKWNMLRARLVGLSRLISRMGEPRDLSSIRAAACAPDRARC